MAQQIKRSPASLFGGIIITLVMFLLWILITWEPSATQIATGAVASVAVGIWTRLANL